MPILIAGKQPNKSRQSGFTYVMVLAAIVITGIVIGVAEVQTSYVRKREREEELLFRGMAYREAIRSYYESGKPNKTYPRALEDLVKDSRSVHKRHIRTLYTDPLITGKSQWTLIRSVDGGIAGVASTSSETPLKTAEFPQGLEEFQKAESYNDWKFQYQPTLPKVVKPGAISTPIIGTKTY